MKKLVLAAILGLMASGIGFCEVKLAKTPEKVTIENRFIKADIATQGGRIISFYDKKGKIDYALNPNGKDFSGFGKCRFWGGKDLLIKEGFTGKYDYKIMKNGEDGAIVCFTLNLKESHKLKGAKIEKYYSINANEARLEVKYRIKAGEHHFKIMPWIHNWFMLAGNNQESKEAYNVYCQMPKGLYCSSACKSPFGNSNILYYPKEPWMGLVNEKTADGIVEYVPGDNLDHFLGWLNSYDGITMESVYQETQVAPDDSWQGGLAFMPVSGLKQYHFAAPGYVGGFMSENGQNVMKLFAAVDLNDVKIKFAFNKKEVKKDLNSLAAGDTVSVPVDVPSGIFDCEVIVEANGSSQTHSIHASVKPVASEIVPLSDFEEKSPAQANAILAKYLKKTLYVSPSMATIAYFSIKSTFPKTTPKGARKITFNLLLPEGIKVAPDIKISWNQYGKCSDTGEMIEYKGARYRKYSLATLIRNSSSLFIDIFLNTSLKPGYKGKAVFYAEWEGGKQEMQEVNLESINIPTVPMPKKLITGLGWCSIKVYSIWPDFYRDYKKLGLNTVSCSHHDVYDKELKKVVKEAKDNNYFFASNYSPWPQAWGGSYVKEREKDSGCACSIDGVKSRWWCPSYRGTYFKKAVDDISSVADSGISMLFFDCEAWGGSEYCFCDRCMKQFKEYYDKSPFSKKHPYISPKVFEKNVCEYPEYHKLWDEFRGTLGTEMFLAVKESFFDRIAKNSVSSSPYPVLGLYGAKAPYSNFHQFLIYDSLYKSGAINTWMPAFYVGGNAVAVGDSTKKLREYQSNSNIVPWLTAGYGSISSECESVDVKYMLLELFANGARGFTTFTWDGFDGLDFKYLADAMQMVVPVEDIIVDGKVIEGLKASIPDVRLAGLVNNNEMIVLVSEYLKNKPTPVSFNVNVPEDCSLFCMNTFKEIGKLKKGDNKIKITIPASDRAVLLYMGNRHFTKENN
jgi:hypothetical protein